MPSRTETVLALEFAVARLRFPLPVKSPTVTEKGAELVARSERAKETEVVALVMGRKTTFDVPPPGLGLETVTAAVAGIAISEAPTAAVSCELLTKVVGRGLLFQFTTELETKPLPVTVNVNPAPPGTALAGTTG